ncbi:hypothetical protein J437_LFUL004538 [Ladona fulva]|uniref:Uncharacterized protein n=1 Tax=Ladona fulva TaxID=123851 RepID=A0A8K0K916_LADFU|nr:hypothetical protein J437_LFUL004538 [Ladona fulva]
MDDSNSDDSLDEFCSSYATFAKKTYEVAVERASKAKVDEEEDILLDGSFVDPEKVEPLISDISLDSSSIDSEKEKPRKNGNVVKGRGRQAKKKITKNKTKLTDEEDEEDSVLLSSGNDSTDSLMESVKNSASHLHSSSSHRIVNGQKGRLRSREKVAKETVTLDSSDEEIKSPEIKKRPCKESNELMSIKICWKYSEPIQKFQLRKAHLSPILAKGGIVGVLYSLSEELDITVQSVKQLQPDKEKREKVKCAAAEVTYLRIGIDIFPALSSPVLDWEQSMTPRQDITPLQLWEDQLTFSVPKVLESSHEEVPKVILPSRRIRNARQRNHNASWKAVARSLALSLMNLSYYPPSHSRSVPLSKVVMELLSCRIGNLFVPHEDLVFASGEWIQHVDLHLKQLSDAFREVYQQYKTCIALCDRLGHTLMLRQLFRIKEPLAGIFSESAARHDDGV